MPADWHEVEIHYRFGATTYHIHMKNSPNTNDRGTELTLNGNSPNDETILLADDGGEHTIHVIR